MTSNGSRNSFPRAPACLPQVIVPPDGSFTESVLRGVAITFPEVAYGPDYETTVPPTSAVIKTCSGLSDDRYPGDRGSITFTTDTEACSQASIDEPKREEAGPPHLDVLAPGQGLMVVATIIMIVCLTALDVTIQCEPNERMA